MAGLTDQGFVTPRFDDVAGAIRAEYVTREGSGRVPDWTRNRVLGLLTTIMALLLVGAWESLQQVYNSFRVNGARGDALDNLCELVGVQRQRETFSTVVLSFSGTGAEPIPAGFLAEDTDGNRWITIEDGAVGGTAAARALELGPVTADPGTITTGITSITGLTLVTNAAAAAPGRARESDDELRARRLDRIQNGTRTTVGGIRTAVQALDFIESVLVVENDTNSTLNIDGIPIPAKAFTTSVYPPNLSAAQRIQVAETIRDSKPAGIQASGDLTESLASGATGSVPIVIGFREAQAVTAVFVVTVTPFSGFSVAEVEPEIRRDLIDYVSALRVGEPVLLLDVYRVLSGIDGIQSATVTIDGSAADFSVAINQFAITADADITVA